MWFLGLGPLLVLPILLPDGRPPSRRWRPVAWYAGATLTASLVALALFPWLRVGGEVVANPLGVPAAGPVFTALTLAGVPVVVACLAALVVRVRRAAERRALLPVLLQPR